MRVPTCGKNGRCSTHINLIALTWSCFYRTQFASLCQSFLQRGESLPDFIHEDDGVSRSQESAFVALSKRQVYNTSRRHALHCSSRNTCPRVSRTVLRVSCFICVISATASAITAALRRPERTQRTQGWADYSPKRLGYVLVVVRQLVVSGSAVSLLCRRYVPSARSHQEPSFEESFNCVIKVKGVVKLTKDHDEEASWGVE